MFSESEVAQSCPTLCDPWTVAHQAPLSMGFSRQEYWSALLFPSPGDLPDPGGHKEVDMNERLNNQRKKNRAGGRVSGN